MDGKKSKTDELMDEEGFEAFKNTVEAQEFKDPIDVVMFFEQ